MFFRFLDPGKLVDDELELLSPRTALVDKVLLACADERTRELMPREASVTREDLSQFIQANPNGRQAGRAAEGRVPAYHFWMHVTGKPARQQIAANAVVAGGIALRIGGGHDIEMYYGHVGYHVYPPSRGNHYAARSVRLILPLAHRHGLKELWITCNPDNIPSRRTCERLGAEMVEIVDVPEDHPLYLRGETQKCRYKLPLP